MPGRSTAITVARARVPDFEAEAYVAEVKRRHEYLRSRGIAYLPIIVPEKFTIYPEYLPSWVAPGRNPTLLARTMDRLAEDGSVPYVDLRPVLRETKGGERLYYLTDSHWNLAGAGVAYVAIMHAVQALLPGRLATVAPPVRPPYIAAATSTGVISPGPWASPFGSRSPTTCRLTR
jgi:hypothetical protein